MKLLMAANWKMYKTGEQGAAVLADLGARLASLPADREVAVFAPFTALSACSRACPPNRTGRSPRLCANCS